MIGGVIINKHHPEIKQFYPDFRDAHRAYKAMSAPFRCNWTLMPWIRNIREVRHANSN